MGAILELNTVQRQVLKTIKEKIKRKHYVFEDTVCLVCKQTNFGKILDFDRYGLRHPTVICKDCGLIQSTPRMSEKNYKEFYEKEYRKLYLGEKELYKLVFDNGYSRGKGIYDYVSGVMDEPVVKKFVVEIGCGIGGILQYFKEKDNRVFGVDWDNGAVKYGCSRGLPLVRGGIGELSGLSTVPDIVLFVHVVEHFLNPIKEFESLKEFIDHDTLVYVEVPSVKYFHKVKAYEKDFQLYLQNAHVFHYTLVTLNNSLSLAGFELVRGNEVVNSVFRLRGFDNDYSRVFGFLKRKGVMKK